MALRLFGSGSSRGRTCPACEAKIATDASFCPSCYMVFRPEGAAALREHLGGSRVPADVYLLRKLQTQDPDTGPVERKPVEAPLPPPRPAPPAPPPEPEGSDILIAPDPLALFQDEPELLLPDIVIAPPAEIDPAPELPLSPEPTASPQARTGVESFFTFGPPLPPATRSVDGLPVLLAWMLEHDPVIPNNLARLEAIHAERFEGLPAGRLSYEQHLLLLTEDDLRLHPTQERFDAHLLALIEAYRRAAEAYQAAPSDRDRASGPLWEMASAASRLRLEAWIYRTCFGGPPPVVPPGRRRRPRPSR